jgi:hypothetical protein
VKHFILSSVVLLSGAASAASVSDFSLKCQYAGLEITLIQKNGVLKDSDRSLSDTAFFNDRGDLAIYFGNFDSNTESGPIVGFDLFNLQNVFSNGEITGVGKSYVRGARNPDAPIQRPEYKVTCQRI